MFETPGFQNRPFLCYDMHAKTGREERSIFDNMKTKWKKTGGILLAVLVVLGVLVLDSNHPLWKDLLNYATGYAGQ